MKIRFLLPVLTQPRFQKRIDAILAQDIVKLDDIEIISFEREYIPNTFKYPHRTMGNISHGSYAQRIYKLFLATIKLIRIIKRQDIVYCFGFDMALIACLQNVLFFRRNRIVYEIADIRSICLKNNIFGKIVRILEKFIVHKVFLLVSTSLAYVTNYYQGILKINNFRYQIIENKILNEIKKIRFLRENNGLIKVGYFGLLRDYKSWEILKKISELPRFEVIVYGYPFRIENFQNDLARYKKIKYKGTYDGYNEIYKIYNEVDIVWAVYPYSNSKEGNWQWARTNRFYESCYFKKPMIVSLGTQDAKFVDEYQIGLTINLSFVNKTILDIDSIKEQNINFWKENIHVLPESIYKYSDEHKYLLEKLLK